MPVFRHAQPHPESGESRLGVLWICSALSALVQCLAINGTLSSWTQAIVTHTNTVGTGTGTIALKVAATNGSTCTSSDAEANSVDCAIDLFGDNGTAITNLKPLDTATTIVTLSNVGDSAATNLNMAPGPCSDADALCNNLLLSMICTGAANRTFNGTMTEFGESDGDFSTVPLTVLPNAEVTVCTFKITLPLTAPPSTSGQTLSQVVVWTLS
jgi:hypothetical protein